MKQHVSLSTYCITVTIIALLLLGGLFTYGLFNSEQWVVTLVGIMIAIALLSSLFYMPVTISVNRESVIINRPLCDKELRMDEIKSIKLMQPSALSTSRLCGSNGMFGYWGWFRDNEHGRYFAYYGKVRDCFIIELRNGRKYMLSCDNCRIVTNYIQQYLNELQR